MSINNTSYSCHHDCRKIVESFCQSYGVHIMHASVGVDTHTHTHTHTYTHTHMHTHTYTHTHMDTHPHIHVHAHACTCTQPHTQHTHTYQLLGQKQFEETRHVPMASLHLASSKYIRKLLLIIC